MAPRQPCRFRLALYLKRPRNHLSSITLTFPKSARSPIGNVITQALWSTGRLVSQPGVACFSQTFTLTVGTFYFGDYDYYNLTNMRDVLVVTP